MNDYKEFNIININNKSIENTINKIERNDVVKLYELDDQEINQKYWILEL